MRLRQRRVIIREMLQTPAALRANDPLWQIRSVGAQPSGVAQHLAQRVGEVFGDKLGDVGIGAD
jgi:hypothetical protein